MPNVRQSPITPTMRLFQRTLGIGSLWLAASACAAPIVDGHHDHESEPAHAASTSEALSSIDCRETTATGYTKGEAFKMTIITVDEKNLERETGNAYYAMAKAAANDGVHIKVVSGFRTMAQQEYLYSCYKNCSCNSCNLAAKPGYSNHQSGHALDLNTSAPGVYDWLAANAGTYGFKRTVPSEKWHWEWWGGGPGGGPCDESGTFKSDGSGDGTSGNGNGSGSANQDSRRGSKGNRGMGLSCSVSHGSVKATGFMALLLGLSLLGLRRRRRPI